MNIKKGWAKGGEIHEMIVDLVEMVFGTMDIETIRDYREDGFIYDLYIPTNDSPIEVGTNKINKLNYLFNNKDQFFVVPLGESESFVCDWLATGKKQNGWKFPYYLVYGWKKLKIISISKDKLPGHKRAADWMATSYTPRPLTW